MISMVDIGWAAGFLEGEGSFFRSQAVSVVTAAQDEFYPVEKLQRLFGGRFSLCVAKRSHGEVVYGRWNATGETARGVMMTIYSLMSPRRKDKIREVLQEDLKSRRYVSKKR